MRKKHTHKIAAALSRATEFPMESMCPIPLFVLKGSEEAEVSGCLGILEYDDTRVVIKTAENVITVEGRRLILSGFHNDTLRIRGRISAVYTEGEEGRAADRV